MLRPCLDCNELTHRSRCEECEARFRRVPEARARVHASKSSTARGYDGDWKRLSRIARSMQAFCSDCGATHDLQADHSPEAWRRKRAGKRIRLQDIDVVCGPCNRARGAARGENSERV